jgi:lipoate-protein ligase A
VPQEILELADKLKEELTSEETLFEDTGRNHKLLKIREGVFLERESLRILRDKE